MANNAIPVLPAPGPPPFLPGRQSRAVAKARQEETTSWALEQLTNDPAFIAWQVQSIADAALRPARQARQRRQQQLLWGALLVAGLLVLGLGAALTTASCPAPTLSSSGGSSSPLADLPLLPQRCLCDVRDRLSALHSCAHEATSRLLARFKGAAPSADTAAPAASPEDSKPAPAAGSGGTADQGAPQDAHPQPQAPPGDGSPETHPNASAGSADPAAEASDWASRLLSHHHDAMDATAAGAPASGEDGAPAPAAAAQDAEDSAGDGWLPRLLEHTQPLAETPPAFVEPTKVSPPAAAAPPPAAAAPASKASAADAGNGVHHPEEASAAGGAAAEAPAQEEDALPPTWSERLLAATLGDAGADTLADTVPAAEPAAAAAPALGSDGGDADASARAAHPAPPASHAAAAGSQGKAALAAPPAAPPAPPPPSPDPPSDPVASWLEKTRHAALDAVAVAGRHLQARVAAARHLTAGLFPAAAAAPPPTWQQQSRDYLSGLVRSPALRGATAAAHAFWKVQTAWLTSTPAWRSAAAGCATATRVAADHLRGPWGAVVAWARPVGAACGGWWRRLTALLWAQCSAGPCREVVERAGALASRLGRLAGVPGVAPARKGVKEAALQLTEVLGIASVAAVILVAVACLLWAGVRATFLRARPPRTTATPPSPPGTPPTPPAAHGAAAAGAGGNGSGAKAGPGKGKGRSGSKTPPPSGGGAPTKAAGGLPTTSQQEQQASGKKRLPAA